MKTLFEINVIGIGTLYLIDKHAYWFKAGSNVPNDVSATIWEADEDGTRKVRIEDIGTLYNTKYGGLWFTASEPTKTNFVKVEWEEWGDDEYDENDCDYPNFLIYYREEEWSWTPDQLLAILSGKKVKRPAPQLKERYR